MIRKPGADDAPGLSLCGLYKIVGTGTRLLTNVRPGESVDLLGPLGTAFSFPNGLRRAAVMGRGIGIAPLLFWALEAAQRGIYVHAFLSARTGAMLFGADELARAGVHVYTGADDGTGYGSDGLLSQFSRVCQEHQIELALTCGSTRMARMVRALDATGALYGEVSLEAQMGCAMGACRGCPVKVKADGADDVAPENAAPDNAWRYALVCQEGPVFAVREVAGT